MIVWPGVKKLGSFERASLGAFEGAFGDPHGELLGLPDGESPGLPDGLIEGLFEGDPLVKSPWSHLEIHSVSCQDHPMERRLVHC